MATMQQHIIQATAAFCLVVASLGSTNAWAQSPAEAWPTQTVKIVVPFAAGGATDVLARVLTERLSVALKQAVVAENRPGAGSTLGASYVATAKPDGYTLMILSTSHLFAPEIYKDLPYNALTSFVPVTRLASGGFVMTVNNSVPATTVKEFIALAKAQPGKLNFGSSGTGGNQHLITQMFLNAAGIDVKHIPYKGSTAATTDLIGGQTELGFMSSTNALPQVKAGRLRGLAVTSKLRLTEFPNLPTLSEVGLPGFEATAWLGMVAPKGTPPTVIARIDSELQKIMVHPDTKAILSNAGFDVDLAGPADFGDYMRSESGKWLRLARSLNMAQ